MSGLLSQSKRGVIAFSGFMLSARRRHFFACFLVYVSAAHSGGVPLAELNRFAGMHCSPMKLGALHYLVWRPYGSFSLACEPSCAPLPPAPPWGVPGTMTTTTFLLTEKWWRWSCLLRPSVQAHLRGRWERQMCRPVLMYSFGTFMPMKTGRMVRPSCVTECRGS